MMRVTIPVTAGLIALTLAPACGSAVGCRCQERALADYWTEADEVVVGRFVGYGAATPSASAAGTRELRFELTAGPHKVAGPSVSRRDRTIAYRSPTSTAACGVQGVEGSLYVLFAHRVEGEPALRIDSCSGTRVLSAPGIDQAGGFLDVPARFVIQQLNGLAGNDVLAEVIANAPTADAVAPTADPTRALLGLLDVAGFTHAGFARLHVQPDTASPLLTEIASYEALETRESGYEEKAAVVQARANGWYRLRLSDGREGWLPPDLAGTYFPYPDIALRRLNYIPKPWHGFVWPVAGAGLPVRTPDDPSRREVAIEVLERMDIGGFPWLRVEVFSESPCEVPEPNAIASGWIPAWAPDGAPQVWYYSRGC